MYKTEKVQTRDFILSRADKVKTRCVFYPKPKHHVQNGHYANMRFNVIRNRKKHIKSGYFAIMRFDVIQSGEVKTQRLTKSKPITSCLKQDNMQT